MNTFDHKRTRVLLGQMVLRGSKLYKIVVIKMLHGPFLVNWLNKLLIQMIDSSNICIFSTVTSFCATKIKASIGAIIVNDATKVFRLDHHP